jgi:hypothetical protein
LDFEGVDLETGKEMTKKPRPGKAGRPFYNRNPPVSTLPLRKRQRIEEFSGQQKKRTEDTSGQQNSSQGRKV